jgi:thiol-disulfide isomerase/thioredoxin
MRYLKQIFIITFFIGLFFVGNFSLASENITEINFFYSTTCPHCAKEQIFLDDLESRYPNISINRWEIAKYKDLAKQFYQNANIPSDYWGATPVTFINQKAFLGFNEKETGLVIEKYLSQITESCIDAETTDTASQSAEDCEKDISPEIAQTMKNVKIPFIGEIDLSNFSIMSLTIIIGALDGFNACAMAALGFLLAVLVATGVRKRVFWIGGTFIFISGLMYFLFISAWLNLFLFVGYLKIISLIIGVLIITFAAFLLKDYFSGIVCKLCNIDPTNTGVFTKWQRKLFVCMDKLVSMEMALPITLLGVAVIAIGINLVELVCSLGFPMAYAKILSSLNLSAFAYYGYLLIYVFFYMLDDFIIFIIAVMTLRLTNVGDRYLKAIKLISGLVLLIIGIIMLIKPELLSLS